MAETETLSGNLLAQETSPYLIQHKDNPVDWRPWGPEALAAAKAQEKPILLSIGYAACHWCHVMAHESFEDPEIAGLMNRYFVNIKVDREERPDLDTIYQSALALLGEQGGWPLTMFLTPAGEPFWGGTYFPPQSRYGRPGFPQVLERVAEVFAEQPAQIAQNVKALAEGLQKLSTPAQAGEIPAGAIDQVAEHLAREIDPVDGGLGGAPKFPQPAILKLLWRAWHRRRYEPCRDAVRLTLSRMCQGGIYDHLGGGFARYSVDSRWLVPHFEKMLYDNAQLIELLTWAWQDGGDPLFEARTRETVGWVLREMMAPVSAAPGAPACGGFASTLDADSEGEEGRFYVWSAAEIEAILGPDASRFMAAYDVTPGGNWEGKTILNRSQEPALGSAEAEAALAKQRAQLLDVRGQRVRPGWDDKVLADWNGLMISALVQASMAFKEPAWLDAAAAAYRFVVTEMARDGRLQHAWRHGQLKHRALLDDYANMAEAALLLYEATGDRACLAQAEAWVEILDRHHWDPSSGGYFLTADDATDLIVRTKNAHDNAVPAGNGTMVAVLARLYYLTGRDAYRDRADALITAFAGELGRNFPSLATLLNGYELLRDALQIVVIGTRGDADTAALIDRVAARSLPNRILQIIAPGDALAPGHPAAGKGQVDGRATAYICRGATCSLPIADPDELGQALGD